MFSVCSTPDFATITTSNNGFNAQARVVGGVLQTRAYASFSIYVAGWPSLTNTGSCDSGWINGGVASCNSISNYSKPFSLSASSDFGGVNLSHSTFTSHAGDVLVAAGNTSKSW